MPHYTTLEKFLEGPARNAWTVNGPVRAYVRKSLRPYVGGKLHCLDIASVEVEESQRGKWRFADWYEIAEAAAKKHGLNGIYVESVMNPIMEGFCERHGFVRVGNYGAMSLPNFIKPIAPEKQGENSNE